MSKKKKILTIVDKDTGEINSRIELQDKTFGDREWFAMFRGCGFQIATSNLTGEQYRVLFYLFDNLNFDNYISIKQKDIVDALHINKHSVSRSIRALKENNIIYEDPMDKNYYKLNPYIGYKGRKKYDATVVEFEKIKQQKEDEVQLSEM